MGKQVRAAALAVTAVIVLGTLSGCSNDGPDSRSTVSSGAVDRTPMTAPTPTPTPAPTPAPTAAPARGGVLTHSGYGPVRLGMSVAALRHTGAVTVHIMSHDKSGCAGTFKMKSDPGVTGYVSWMHGVVAIFAARATRTLEGIHNGSSSAAALKAYPRARASVNGWFAPLEPVAADAETDYRFSFAHGDHGSVSDLFLQLSTEDCYE